MDRPAAAAGRPGARRSARSGSGWRLRLRRHRWPEAGAGARRAGNTRVTRPL